MALVGPGKTLSRAAPFFLGTRPPFPRPRTELVAVAVTDGPHPGLAGAGIPVYTQWRELVAAHQVQIVVNMSSDPAIRSEIRKGLPLDTELQEFSPGSPSYASFLARHGLAVKLGVKQSMLETLLDALPIPAMVYDAHGRVQSWNRACEKLTGIAATDVLGRREVGTFFYTLERPLLGQLVVADAPRSLIRKYYGEHSEITPIEDGFQVVGSYHGLKPGLNGHYLTMARRIKVQGRVAGAVELVQDLSPVEQLKLKSRQHQNQLRAIMSHMPFPLIQTDLTGKILFANPDAHELLYPLLEKGQHLRSSSLFKLAPALGTRFESSMRSRSFDSASSSQESFSSTFKVLWNEVDWEVTYFLIPGKPGSWTVAWILYNLTGKEEKSRVNAALAVAGAISHELSQPLTAIINSAQLLVGTPTDNLERLKRHRNIIARESSRIFDLHRKLQNISKYKLKDYLDTHIFDLDESSELSLTIPDTPDEE